MKRTKNAVAYFVAVVMVAVSMLLSACGDGDAKVKLIKNNEKLVVIEAIASGGSLEDALKELKDAASLIMKALQASTAFI